MASMRHRLNRITVMRYGDTRLKTREDITTHIVDFFQTLCAKEDWDRPSLDNLEFVNIREHSKDWLEREFKEHEVWAVVFNSGGDKAPGPDGFSMIFFQRFWDIVKEDVISLYRQTF